MSTTRKPKTREQLIQDAILLLLNSITSDGLLIDVTSSDIATESTLAIAQNSLGYIEAASSFDITPGNTKTTTYYTGVEAGNPSGDKNVETITYAGTLNFTKTFTYDSSNDILTVTIS